MARPTRPAPNLNPSPISNERRQSQRRSITLYVRYRRIDPNDLAGCQPEYRDAICRNISDGGMLLEIDAHVPRGQVLEVYASERGSPSTIFGIVETVRTVRTPGEYEVGVRFLKQEKI